LRFEKVFSLRRPRNWFLSVVDSDRMAVVVRRMMSSLSVMKYLAAMPSSSGATS
jgi:hypothetical protein